MPAPPPASVSPVTEDLARAVAAEIERLMAERGVSGNALSKATGIPQTSISRKLNGPAAFDLNDLVAISHALGVDIRDLLEWARRA